LYVAFVKTTGDMFWNPRGKTGNIYLFLLLRYMSKINSNLQYY